MFIVSLALIIFFWDFVNQNSSSVQAITTLVLILVTALYSIYTRKMLSIMMFEQESKFVPDIAIRFVKNNASHYQIEIENISNVEIFNLKFIKYPDLPLADNRKTSDIGFIKNGVKYLGRGQKYDTLFLNLVWLHEDKKMNEILQFEIEFTSNKNQKYIKNFDLNLNLYCNTMSDSSLISELKNININLENITKYLKK